jgi:hypothetical protein
MRLRFDPSTRSAAPTAAAALLILLAAAGCEEERHVKSSSAGKSKNAVAHAPAAAPQPEFIVGKRTQEIVNATPEEKEGTKVSDFKITAKDYITMQGNAYVSIIGKTAVMNIDHAVDLYRATNDRYPKDYEEFMADIIKANNISLPQLPYYQKYGYDEANHKLVVLESESLKNNPPGR